MERNVKIGIAVAAVAGVVVIAAIAGIVIAMLSVSDDEGAPSNGILYKGNGGTFDGDSSFTMNETQVTSCPFTKDGYHFKIWNTKADGSGTDYAPDSIAPAKTTLYAIWSDANTLDGYNLFWGNLVSVYLSETGSTTRVNIDGTGADIAPTNAVVIFTLKLEGATISMDDSEILIPTVPDASSYAYHRRSPWPSYHLWLRSYQRR